MKTILFTLCLTIATGLMTSCNNDDTPYPTNEISGSQYLLNVRGGLASIYVDYLKGSIKWNFDEVDGSLTVQNNIGDDHAFMLPSGTYDFEVEQNGDAQVLFVDKPDYRMVILSIDRTLVITDDMNDGFTAKFNR